MLQRCLLAVLVLLPLLASVAVGQSSKVEELIERREAAKDAVIQLSESDFKRYIVGASRDYTVAIFFQATQLVDSQPSLRLPELRMEFGYAAKAFSEGPDADKIFFFEALLEDSSAPFAVFQVNSLPYVVRITPDKDIIKPPIELSRAEKMVPDSIPEKFPWSAETFVKYLGGKDLQAAEINRPSFFKSPLFPFAVLLALVLVGLVAYRAYHSDFVRKPALWATGSLVVFWWSVSGGMYNYIRGMPLFIRDRNGNLQFFLKGRSGSLGAEGMIIAGTYLLFSVSLALITYVFPRIYSAKIRDPLCYLFVFLAAFSIYQSFTIWQSKTGFGIVSYLW